MTRKMTALALFAALSVAATVTTGLAQQKMVDPRQNVSSHKSFRATRTSDVIVAAMKELSPPEKKTVAAMIAKLSPAEKASLMHALQSCVGKGPMPRRAISVVSTGKMTPSEKATYQKMIARMTPEQRVVTLKMLSTCCTLPTSAKTTTRGRG